MISIVYIGVLLLLVALAQAAERNPKAYLTRNRVFSIRPDPGAALILTVVLILVSGFRYGVGTDFFSYYRWKVFDWEWVWKDIITFDEGGFSLLAKLSRTVWDNNQSLILFSAVITIGLYCLTIYKYSSMFTISMLLYLFMGEWQGGFNGIRQYLAAAVLFAGHRYILDKNWLKYSAVVLLAAMFHTTALVMVIPYFLLTRKPDISQLILLTIGAIVIRFSYEVIFRFIGVYKGTTLNSLSGLYMANEVNVFRILVAFIPVAIYVLFCRKNNLTKEQEFYINICLFNSFSMFAGMGSTYLARIGIYTNAAVTVGYSHMFGIIDDEKTKKWMMAVILAMFFVYWIYSLSAGKISTFRWAIN